MSKNIFNKLGKKVFVGIVPIIFVGVFLCAKPVVKNIFVESNKYREPGTPPNSNFKDMNLYKCVISNYNQTHQHDINPVSMLSYEDTITDAQLATLNKLDCTTCVVAYDDNHNIDRFLSSYNVDDDGTCIIGDDIVGKGLDIIDTSGIERMTNLTDLTLNGSYSQIDLNHNTKLKKLIISSKNLSSVDLSHNTDLSFLVATHSDFTNINLSNNPNLEHLFLHNSHLKHIDLSNNPNIFEKSFSPQEENIYINPFQCGDFNDEVLERLLSEKELPTNSCDLFDQVIQHLGTNLGRVYASTEDDYYALMSDGSKEYYKYDYSLIFQHFSMVQRRSDPESDYYYQHINNDQQYVFVRNQRYDRENKVYTKVWDSFEEFVDSEINFYNLDHEVVDDSLLVKYHGNFTREYPIVSISSSKYNVNGEYIYGDKDDILNNVSVTNGTFEFDEQNNQFLLKYNDHVIASYMYINASSDKYDITSDTIKVEEHTIEDFLSHFDCINCYFNVQYVKDDVSYGAYEFRKNYNYILRVEHEITPYNLTCMQTFNLEFAVGNVFLDSDAFTLNAGRGRKLNATVWPDYATNTSVVWSSSDESIATVDSSGYVTAIGAGEATITVTADDGHTDTCVVTVTDSPYYTVTYRLSDDENDNVTRTFIEDENIISGFNEPGLMYVQGKKIVGWTYNNQFYSLYDELLMPSNDIELVARWETISDGISYYDVEYISPTNKILKSDKLKFGASDLRSDLIFELGSEYTVVVYKSDNSTVNDSGNIGTGDIVKLYIDDVVVDKYTISIKGDLNGDGEFKIGDIVKLYNYMYDGFPGYCYKKAADYNNDGKNLVGDIVKMYNALFTGQ